MLLVMIITSMITVAILRVISILQGLGFGFGPQVTSNRGSRLQTPRFRGLRFRV